VLDLGRRELLRARRAVLTGHAVQQRRGEEAELGGVGVGTDDVDVLVGEPAVQVGPPAVLVLLPGRHGVGNREDHG
jgi:hypothetical protein